MKNSQKKLLDTWQNLSEQDQQTVTSFAEFLLEKNGSKKADIPQQPLDIPRPEEENVIAAIKRLSKTYPMVDSNNLFNETSSLMTQHMMQGRDAIEVIDELEIVFKRHYQLTIKEE